jgi:hypothetical protein
MVIDVRLEQKRKALLPMDVTELGIVIDLKLVQDWKVPYAINFTESDIFTYLALHASFLFFASI